MTSLNDLLLQYFQESLTQALSAKPLEPEQLEQLSELIKNGVDNLLSANATLQDIEKAQNQLIAEVLPKVEINDLSDAAPTPITAGAFSSLLAVAAVPTGSQSPTNEHSCRLWPFCFR
jgi:nicotinate-nucleotide pyrophosphorylase